MSNRLGRLMEMLQCEHQPVFTIHYACEAWPSTPTGRTGCVVAIAVHSLASGLTRLFSCSRAAEREQIPELQMMNHLSKLEEIVFADFNEFLGLTSATSPHALWVHWAMRDATFGWPLLEHRNRVLGLNRLSLGDDQLVDLHAILAQEYGAEFVPRPRLLRLAELNGGKPGDFLSGSQEAESFRQGCFDKLDRSVSKKVEVMGQLLRRFVQGDLKVKLDGKTRRSSRFLKRARPLIHYSGTLGEHLEARDAAKFCGISRATWYRMCAAGQVPAASRLGRRRLWLVDELRAWLEAKCPSRSAWENRIQPMSGRALKTNCT